MRSNGRGVRRVPSGSITKGSLRPSSHCAGHGFDAFPTMGIVIEASYERGTPRVAPDGCVLLPPGVLVFLEYERSAQDAKGSGEKGAETIKRFAELESRSPRAFHHRQCGTPEPSCERRRQSYRGNDPYAAAETLAALRCPLLLATDMDSLKAGPHGKAVYRGRLGRWRAGLLVVLVLRRGGPDLHGRNRLLGPELYVYLDPREGGVERCSWTTPSECFDGPSGPGEEIRTLKPTFTLLTERETTHFRPGKPIKMGKNRSTSQHTYYRNMLKPCLS